MEENSLWKKEIWLKYREGTATQKELEQLQAYLQQQHRPELEQLFGEEQAEEMPIAMAGRIRAQLEQAAARETTIVRQPRSLAKWMAAAAVFIAVLAGSYYFVQRNNEQLASVSVTYDSIINISDAPRLVRLPDATEVWLNKKAKLYVSTTYARQRLVKLTGEAYFDVKRNAANPLVVQTGNVSTTVLGTAFNIDNSSYNTTRISLVQGKVQVSKAGKTTTPVLLSPGETAIAGQQADTIATSATGVADVAGWMRGNLVLNQLPLSEALQKAADYYELTIRADDALLQGRTVNTIYYKHQHWQQVLQHLLFMYHLTYTYKNNVIVITGQ